MPNVISLTDKLFYRHREAAKQPWRSTKPTDYKNWIATLPPVARNDESGYICRVARNLIISQCK